MTGQVRDAKGIHSYIATPIVDPTPSLNPNGTQIDISLITGNKKGVNADWWLVAYAPSGHWYSYIYPSTWADLGTDLSKVTPAYQGALVDISNFGLFDTKGIPTGQYSIYFGVDTNMNGVLDYNQLYYSKFTFNVP